jgi:hypothetical protein
MINFNFFSTYVSEEILMFKIAGTTRFKGEYKVRFGTDFASRIKMLIKQGHEEVEMLELPSEMTKGQAVRHLLTLKDRFSAGALEAIEDADSKYSGTDSVRARRTVGQGRGARPEKFPYAGTTVQGGVCKVRMVSDVSGRKKLLEKQGHTDINLIQLPEPLNKADAVKHLLTRLDEFSPVAQTAIQETHARISGENTVTVSGKSTRVRASKTAVTAAEVLAAVASAEAAE